MNIIGVVASARGNTPEWLYNVMQSILGSMYNYFYGKCTKFFISLFTALNVKVEWAADELTTSPQAWNSGAFSLARSVAENTLMPIAACIVTFIFCWQLIHLMQDSNRMQNVKADNILFVLICLGLCILACSKSFDIVMGFFEIGADATRGIIGKSTVGSFGEGLSIEDILPRVTEDYSFGDVMDTMVASLVLGLSTLLVYVIAAIIYVRINLWFVELLIYASAAPIPLATFGNKEWSQVGMNYIRKMLAVCFEGFFMLLSFALFGAVTSGIGGGNFYESMVMIISAAFALCIILFKAGNISASIFNAH